MRRTALVGLAASLALGPSVFVGGTAAGRAASFDCNARKLSESETAICQDAQLSRTDDQIARRIAGLSRRLNFGQYLGLRHWQSGWAQTRDDCGADRLCLGASYRAQGRFLDRLQQCLDLAPQRRGCLRNTLNIELEAVRR